MLLMGLHRASASVPTFIALHWFCIKGNNMVKPCNEQSALCWRKRINRTFRLLVRTKQWIMPPVLCGLDAGSMFPFQWPRQLRYWDDSVLQIGARPRGLVWHRPGGGAGGGQGAALASLPADGQGERRNIEVEVTRPLDLFLVGDKSPDKAKVKPSHLIFDPHHFHNYNISSTLIEQGEKWQFWPFVTRRIPRQCGWGAGAPPDCRADAAAAEQPRPAQHQPRPGQGAQVGSVRAAIVRYIRCIQTTVSNKLTIVPAWNIKVAGGCGFLETRHNNGGLQGCTALLLTFKHLPRCPSVVSQPASESSRQLCRAVNEPSRSFTVPGDMLNRLRF